MESERWFLRAVRAAERVPMACLVRVKRSRARRLKTRKTMLVAARRVSA
jgi:hypothetical protein